MDPDGDLLLVLRKQEKGKTVVNVNVLVSSKHMTLASCVFKTKLVPDSIKNGAGSTASGKIEISLIEDDSEAFIVLLNVIHGRNRLVPLTLSLDLLTKVAVLVEKYNLHDVVAVFGDIWVFDAMDRSDSGYFLQVSQWLCIAWVFKDEELFNTVSCLAVKFSKKGFSGSMDGLPLPPHIIGKK